MMLHCCCDVSSPRQPVCSRVVLLRKEGKRSAVVEEKKVNAKKHAPQQP
jgi:hypothetical protein